MKKIIACFCLFVVIISSYGQNTVTLLDEIEILNRKVYQKKVSFEEFKTDVEVYLKKAKKQKSNLLIGRGYYVLGIKVPDFERRIHYLDSAIFYTRHLKDNTDFPLLAYIAKGSVLHEKRDYNEALDAYLLAESIATSTTNADYQFYIKINIGFLKRVLGNYKEAEIVFNEYITHLKSEGLTKVSNYLYTLFQLSSIYYETGEVEKCTAINVEGIQVASEHDKKELRYLFVANEGINLNIKGKYQASIDSIEKASPYLSAQDRVVSDFYLAKSYASIGEKKKAIHFFKKIDTIFNETNDLFPPLRTTYEYLIKYSKQKKDKELQLYYTNQLLKLDSIIHADYKYLSRTITKEYDNLKLVADKEDLIASLKKEKEAAVNERDWTIEIGILISSLLLGGLLYYYQSKRKYKKYKKLYEAIVEKSNASIEEEFTVKNSQTIKVTGVIDEVVVKEVLQELEIFEKEHLYLKNQISLNDVAKIVNTNSKYLSKIINSSKGKNFTTYINDLRIDYLVDRIQHDPVYQKYTIRAIATEVGFSNPQAFYRVFQKRTGLKPGYFIKKIKEDQQKD